MKDFHKVQYLVLYFFDDDVLTALHLIQQKILSISHFLFVIQQLCKLFKMVLSISAICE